MAFEHPCITVEQVTLDLEHTDVIGGTLEVHTAMFLTPMQPSISYRLSNNLVTLNAFMAPIVTFMKRKTNTIIEEKKTEVAFA